MARATADSSRKSLPHNRVAVGLFTAFKQRALALRPAAILASLRLTRYGAFATIGQSLELSSRALCLSPFGAAGACASPAGNLDFQVLPSSFVRFVY